MKTRFFILLFSFLSFLSCQNNTAPTDAADGKERISPYEADRGDYVISFNPDKHISSQEAVDEEQNEELERKQSMPQEPTYKSVTAYMKTMQKAPQIFTERVEDAFEINAAEGTRLRFPAKAFQTEDGTPVAGSVRIEVEEFYSTSDLIKSQLTTVTEGEVLETAGMINLKVYSNGKICELKKDKEVEIEFASNDLKDMQLFNGSRNSAGNVVWAVQDSPVEPVELVPMGNRMSKKELLFLNNLVRNVAGNIYYPKAAADKNIQGVVYVRFFIDKSGRVRRPRIAKSPHNLLSKTVLYAFQNYPNLRLEDYDYVPVNVPLTLPVTFQFKSGQDLSSLFPDNETEKAIAATTIVMDDDNVPVGAGYGRMMRDTVVAPSRAKQEARRQVAGIFRSNELGWINCDRFLDGASPANIYVNLDNDKSDFLGYMVFKNLNSVFPATDMLGQPYFSGVPVDEDVTLVLLKLEDNRFKAAFRDIITEEGLELSNFKFTEMNKMEFSQKLDGLRHSFAGIE